MTRRVGVSVIAAAALAAWAVPAAAAGRSAAPTASFDAGWRFALGDDGAAARPGFDDSAWRAVTLPHDWSIELDPTEAGDTTAGTGFLPGGHGWYRKRFTLPRAYAGKRIGLEFDGVYMDSAVYVDGARVATHAYGYAGFRVDLTGKVHTDGRTADVVAVEVRNQLPSSRWYSGSGIYRNVHLVATADVHVARHGVVATTPGLARRVGAGRPALVRVATTIERAGAAATGAGARGRLTVVNRLRGPGGAVVARSRTAVAAGARQTEADLRVAHPRLWSIDAPHLYRLETEIRAGGRRVDRVRTTVGLRWFDFDPDHGFSLNGRTTKLQGANLHHDAGALGAKVSEDAIVRELRTMQRMGVNAVRTSHNPPAPELVAACERLGLVMMVEAFDTWRTPKVTYDYGRFFDEDSDADVAEMVAANRNSPAVVMWSIGNEIPDSTDLEVGPPIADRLLADVRELDTTRPIVMGSDKYRTPPEPGSAQDVILQKLDGLGLNYNTAGSVDALHKAYPDKFFFESESSSETSSRGVYAQPEALNTGEDHTPGHRGASSYDNNQSSWTMSGEYSLKKDRDRPWFAGQFLWSGFDYIGEPTPYDDVFPVRKSFFGAVDTAGFAKDQFFLFQSQWTTRPMVHLLPMDWTDHLPGEPVQVWAYSNADEVELFLDGRSLGVRRFDTKTAPDGTRYRETTEETLDDKTVTGGPHPGSYTSPNGSSGHLRLRWDVPFAAGRLVAVARRDGREVARDEVRTAGPAAGLRLRADRSALPAGGDALAYVETDVVDARGVTVPGAKDAITYAVQGGALAGTDNGAQEDPENATAATRHAYNGKALAIVRSGARPGPLRVTATAPGLAPVTVALRTVAGDAARGGGDDDGDGDHGGSDAGRGRPVSAISPAMAAPAPPRSLAVDGAPRADQELATAAAGAALDASFSGAEGTVPAALTDGDPATRWSTAYHKDATGLLPASEAARPRDWVTVGWDRPRVASSLTATFAQDDRHARPASVTVRAWDGRAWVVVPGQAVQWGAAAGDATRITFDPVSTTRLRVDMVSGAPGTPGGSIGIGELHVLGDLTG